MESIPDHIAADPHLRLRHLRCFIATARLESLSAAAEDLKISQPAASKTIRELEELLGVDLFDRSGRNLTLTPAGRLFQSHVGVAMNELRRAQELVQQIPSRLVVGILPTVASEIFPRAALKFAERTERCILQVMTGPNWLLMSQLRDGNLDLIVGRIPSPDRMIGVSFRHLYSERIVLAVRPGHPLAGRPLDPGELAHYPLMLPPTGAVIRTAVRAYLLNAGLNELTPAFESVSLAFGRKTVMKSDTAWFISGGAIRDELENGTLVAVDLGEPLLAGPVGICLRESPAITDHQRIMLEILTEVTDDMRQEDA